MKKLFLIFLIPSLLFSYEPHQSGKAKALLGHVFKQNFKISPLEGGYSEADNFLVEKDRNYYVLKMHRITESFSKLQKERYLMTEAAKAGISPRIHYISPDGQSILMDYVHGKTISIAEAKDPAFCKRLADVLRKTHSISKNPYENENYKMKSEGIYGALADRPYYKRQGYEAIQLIRSSERELAFFNYPKSNIHGDLNPGNILISNQNLQLIDWYETCVEDPFYDLASFAIFHSYTPAEEHLLLSYYLEQEPNEAQKRHYYLTKQVNLCMISLTYYWVSCAGMEGPHYTINDQKSLRDWSFYAHHLALKGQDLSAQFFYEAATRALVDAKKLYNKTEFAVN